MAEKKSPRNIFDVAAEKMSPSVPAGLQSTPTITAVKLIQNQFRTTRLEVLIVEESREGSWEVLLKDTLGIYGERVDYYRTIYSPRDNHVTLERFQSSVRIRLHEDMVKMSLDREELRWTQ